MKSLEEIKEFCNSFELDRNHIVKIPYEFRLSAYRLPNYNIFPMKYRDKSKAVLDFSNPFFRLCKTSLYFYPGQVKPTIVLFSDGFNIVNDSLSYRENENHQINYYSLAIPSTTSKSDIFKFSLKSNLPYDDIHQILRVYEGVKHYTIQLEKNKDVLFTL